MTKISDPIRIGKKTARNRLTYAPSVKFDWTDGSGIPLDRHAKHYGARAKADCGLICVEATCVTPTGRLSPTQLGLWDDNQIEGHRKITEACHAYGSLVLVQIHHGGMNTHPDCGPAAGPSVVECRRGQSVALTVEEIEEIRDQFIEAAVRAQKAGYDGIQLHACHGYLFNQFLADSVNLREDMYGGNTENRTRLACDVIRGIRKACGEDFIISARHAGAQPTVEEGIKAAELYVAAGCDYLQISDGIAPFDREPHDESLPYNECAALGVALHEHFKGIVPVSCVNGIHTVELARFMVENDLVDTVDMSRAVLADPAFCTAAVEGTQNYVKCFNCKRCLYGPMIAHKCPALAKRKAMNPDCDE